MNPRETLVEGSVYQYANELNTKVQQLQVISSIRQKHSKRGNKQKEKEKETEKEKEKKTALWTLVILHCLML
jgi:hypothetical protein